MANIKNLGSISSANNLLRSAAHSMVTNASTTANIEDIDISLIDYDDTNEFLNGYEDIEILSESINETGTKAVIIDVYKKKDGRYLCCSGHSRLKVMQKNGEAKITCNIIDDPGTDNLRAKNLILMNTQRKRRPLYVARNIKKYESILRSEGNKDAQQKTLKQFDVSMKTYYRYMKILKLSDNLQQLCTGVDFPYSVLVDNVESLSEEEQEQLYVQVAKKQSISEESISSSELKDLIDKIKNKAEIEDEKHIVESEEPVEKKSAYVHTACKRFLKLKDNDLSSIIKEHDKERTLEYATELKDYLEEIIEYCKE